MNKDPINLSILFNYNLIIITLISSHYDFYIDRIFEITAEKGSFEAQVNLWFTWNEPRLKKVLEKYNNILSLCAIGDPESFKKTLEFLEGWLVSAKKSVYIKIFI